MEFATLRPQSFGQWEKEGGRGGRGRSHYDNHGHGHRHDSAKGLALKRMVREGFRKHKDVTDAAEIERLRGDATRALSNYLVMKSLNRKDSDRGL